MTELKSNRKNQVLVAIDIAKAKHDVLVELPSGQRKKIIIQNRRSDFEELSAYLREVYIVDLPHIDEISRRGPSVVGAQPVGKRLQKAFVISAPYRELPPDRIARRNGLTLRPRRKPTGA